MKHLNDFNQFNTRPINESKENLSKVAETIYKLVKDRPFSGKQECIRDIVRILRRL